MHVINTSPAVFRLTTNTIHGRAMSVWKSLMTLIVQRILISHLFKYPIKYSAFINNCERFGTESHPGAFLSPPAGSWLFERIWKRKLLLFHRSTKINQFSPCSSRFSFPDNRIVQLQMRKYALSLDCSPLDYVRFSQHRPACKHLMPFDVLESTCIRYLRRQQVLLIFAFTTEVHLHSLSLSSLPLNKCFQFIIEFKPNF